MSIVSKPISPAAKAATFAGVSLFLGLLFDQLFFRHLPGISVAIYVVAILGILVALASVLGRRLPASALWLMVPLGFCAAMVAVRANPLLAFLNIVASILLLLLIARLAFRNDLRSFNLIDYAKIPFLPLKFLAPLGQNLADLGSRRQAVSSHPLAGQIVRGALLAIPVLVVFVALFASADLVFQKYVTAVFNVHISDVTVVRTIIISFVTLAFIGAYAYIFRQPGESTPAAPAKARFSIGQVESGVLLGSVIILFLLFILVQLTYLFGGVSNISSLGFTYAEYARKGFFELLAVAMIAFVLLWAADIAVVKSSTGHTLAFRLLSGALVAEVILIMASAFKRLYLYEQAYGFTTQRLYSHVFVVFLAVVFILLLIKILRNQTENRFALPAFIAAILFLAGMNLLNPDAFIAHRNIDRYHQTGKIDASYLGGLSEDAGPEIDEAINATGGATRQQLVSSLNQRAKPSDWQSWNLARSRAR